MIPGSFTYHRPKSVTEAVRLLADLGDEARPLAGGHSLIPMMKLRFATPEHLIDLRAIRDLTGIVDRGTAISIGAMTTQHALIGSEVLARRLPILAETAKLIADPQVRYMGTIGGNVANGDPGNDMPALMMCLGATYLTTGSGGDRSIPARDFYLGTYFTALEPGQLITAIEIPVPPPGHGWAYEKLKRKVGDYATAAAAVILTRAGGRITACSIGLTNVADTPLFADDAAAALVGGTLAPAEIAGAVAAAEAITRPAADGRGTAEYRTRMAGVMLTRALHRAAARVAA